MALKLDRLELGLDANPVAQPEVGPELQPSSDRNVEDEQGAVAEERKKQLPEVPEKVEYVGVAAADVAVAGQRLPPMAEVESEASAAASRPSIPEPSEDPADGARAFF